MPTWIPTRQFRTWPREGESRLVDFPLVNSPEALLWMVQMHCIDMNAWYSRIDRPDRPDFVLFDLDPPEGRRVRAHRTVAHLIHAALDELGLRSYVKTSGADGIHVLVPIARRSRLRRDVRVRRTARATARGRAPGRGDDRVAEEEARRRPRRPPPERLGQDDRLGLLGPPEAGRAGLDAARVGRADRGVRPRDFTMAVALERIERLGDLFEPALAAASRSARRCARSAASARTSQRGGASCGGGAPPREQASESIPPRWPPANLSASSSSADSST